MDQARTAPTEHVRTQHQGDLAAEVVGAGPPVVLLHGVGLGPATFADLAWRLASVATVATVHRPGYGVRRRPDGTPPVPLARQVDDLADLARALRLGPVTLVGVSGGATLGLLLALSHPEVLHAAVLHEPLVGPLAPDLHRAVVARAEALAADDGPDAAERFVAGLVGSATWDRLPAGWHDQVRRCGDTVRHEVPAFCRVAPEAATLAARRGRPPALVTTVGSSSGTARRQAAGALVDHAGAQARTLAGVGHLAHVEAPAVVAGQVRSLLPTPAGSTA